MSNKKLITIGCSFTSSYDPENEPVYYSHNKWPDLIAKKLGYKTCENYGRSGSGCNYVLHTLIHRVTLDLKNIGLVIVGWPGANRDDQFKVSDPEINWQSQWYGEIFRPDDQKYRQTRWVEEALSTMLAVHHICNSLSIPYIGFQLGPFYGPYDFGPNEKKRLDHIISAYPHLKLNNQKLYRQLKKTNTFINDPKKDLYTALDLYSYSYGRGDLHYTEEGHKLISEWLYDKLQRMGY